MPGFADHIRQSAFADKFPSMWQQFTQPAREAIWRAQAIAIERNCAEVEGAHLFLGVIAGDDEVIATLLQVSGVAGEEARLYAASALQSEPLQPDGEPTLSPDAKRIFRLAFLESNRNHERAIGPEHLLIACVAQQRGPHLGEVLRPLGLDAARLREHLRSLNAAKVAYKKGNPLNSLTEQAKKAIEAAHAAMRASFCGQISTAHLLLGLLGDEEFGSVETLQNIGFDVEDLKRRARESIFSDGHIATPQKKFSPGAKRALERAKRSAIAAGHQFIDCLHLLAGLLPQPETWFEKWRAGGQNLDSVAELWTAKEVELLQLALRGAPVGGTAAPTKIVVGEPLPQLPLIIFGATFFFSVLMGLGMRSGATRGHEPSQHQLAYLLTAVFLLFATGIIACSMLIFSRSKAWKAVWMAAFVGFLMGMFALVFISGKH